MLSIEGRKEWHTHDKSGARFLLRPVDAERYTALRKEARLQDGSTDFVLFAEKVSLAAIEDWEKVGAGTSALPCTEENVRKFARAHAAGVASWVIDQATALDRFLEQESGEAKKD